MITYFKNVIREMKRVTWPSAAQAKRDAGTVLLVSIVFALFMGGADWGLQEIFKWVLAH